MTPPSPRARRRARSLSALVAGAAGSLLVAALPSPALAAPALTAPALATAPAGASDPRGGVRILDVERYDFDGDGIDDSITTLVTVLDARGLVSSNDFTVTDGAGTVIQYLTSTYSYNNRGRLTLVVTEQGDAGGASLIEYVEQEYTAQGEVSRFLLTVDLNADGTIDETREQVSERSPSSFGTSSTESFDMDGDEVIDAVVIRESTLDRRGNPVSESVSVDEGADGTVESLTS